MEIDYERQFSPEAYLSSLYTKKNGSELQAEDPALFFILTNLHKISNMLPSALSTTDSLLIDVGSGPCIQTIVSLSSPFRRIISSDFVTANREAIRKWVDNDPNAHCWDEVIRFCASLENDTTAEEIESRVRNRVVDILPCNVLNDIPVDGCKGAADAVITSFCLEVACFSLEQYRQAMRNVVQLIKPGGNLIMVGSIGESRYNIGGGNMHVLTLLLDDIKEALTCCGMKIDYIVEEKRIDKYFELSDYKGTHVLLATKCDLQ